MAQADILREFLVKLGYKVDETSERRFREGAEKMRERVVSIGKAAAVMATAVAVAVERVSKRFDDLYFASKRIGASAGNIRAFEYAITQMGGSSQAARAALESLAAFMRNSPGAESWIAGLGIQTRDANGNLRDTVDIYTDLADVLSRMDSSQANTVAQMLGLDDGTLQAIRSGDLRAYMEDYQATLKTLGISLEEAAENSAKFQRSLTELKTIIALLVEKYAVKALEFFSRASSTINELSEAVESTPFGRIWADEIQILSGHIKGVVEWLEKAWGFIKLIAGTAWDSWKDKVSGAIGGTNIGGFIGAMTAKVAASFGSKEALAALEANGDVGPGGAGRQGAPSTGARSPAMGGATQSASALFANLERQYGLPAGLLDRIWATESGRGKYMRSRAGAMGHFQFMPATAREFGLANPDDLGQSATAAARYMKQLVDMFGGDLEKAVAAYNWGPGNVRRHGLGAAPAETRDYLRKIAPLSLQTSTTINVHGASDPAGTAQQVANLQGRVSQDQARNLRPVLQ